MPKRNPAIHAIKPGDRFVDWEAVRFVEKTAKSQVFWWCRCRCGMERRVNASKLIDKTSTGCGCRQRETVSRAKRTHGMKNTPEWRVWAAMKDRCYNPNAQRYAVYGARGIAICDRWRDSFEAFYEDMGPRPEAGYQIDRIDNDGPYEPGNCRWATAKQNTRNRRNKRMLTHEGRTLCVAEWAEVRGFHRNDILSRLQRGWSVAEALDTPKGGRR